MKHTIEFNLPEDQAELDIVMHAVEIKSNWDSFGEFMRQISKYGETSEEQRIMLDRVREEYYRLGDL